MNTHRPLIWARPPALHTEGPADGRLPYAASLATRGLDPKVTGQARWTMRGKPALDAFAVTFAVTFADP